MTLNPFDCKYSYIMNNVCIDKKKTLHPLVRSIQEFFGRENKIPTFDIKQIATVQNDIRIRNQSINLTLRIRMHKHSRTCHPFASSK